MIFNDIQQQRFESPSVFERRLIMLHLLSGIYHISLKKCQLVAEKLASNEEQGRTQKFVRGGGDYLRGWQ